MAAVELSFEDNENMRGQAQLQKGKTMKAANVVY